jgi:hypothetical protein
MQDTTKDTPKPNYISAAEATRKLQTKFPYLPDHIGCGFLRYVIPNIFTGKHIYFNIDRINYLMGRIKAADKDTDENIAVNKFINDIVALRVNFRPQRWYSVQDVALKVDHLKCNGKPHYGFESQKQVVDSVSNWLRAHQDKWFDERIDFLSRIDVPNNSKSFKILVKAELMDKMFNAYLAKDNDTDSPFGNEPEVPVLTIPKVDFVMSNKTCDDMVDGEPAFQLCVRGIKFLMKHSSCTELLQNILANKPVDSVQVKDGFKLAVSKDELAELANSILKRL